MMVGIINCVKMAKDELMVAHDLSVMGADYGIRRDKKHSIENLLDRLESLGVPKSKVNFMRAELDYEFYEIVNSELDEIC